MEICSALAHGRGHGFVWFSCSLRRYAGSGRWHLYLGQDLVAAAPLMPPVLLQTAFLMILIGLGTKAGLVPMHTWLPDAHSQAPRRSCAALGVETTAILYVILRLFPVMKAAPNSHAEMWALVLGLISVGMAAFCCFKCATINGCSPFPRSNTWASF